MRNKKLGNQKKCRTRSDDQVLHFFLFEIISYVLAECLLRFVLDPALPVDESDFSPDRRIHGVVFDVLMVLRTGFGNKGDADSHLDHGADGDDAVCLAHGPWLELDIRKDLVGKHAERGCFFRQDKIIISENTGKIIPGDGGLVIFRGVGMSCWNPQKHLFLPDELQLIFIKGCSIVEGDHGTVNIFIENQLLDVGKIGLGDLDRDFWELFFVFRNQGREHF